jgi:hypothetical protein
MRPKNDDGAQKEVRMKKTIGMIGVVLAAAASPATAGVIISDGEMETPRPMGVLASDGDIATPRRTGVLEVAGGMHTDGDIDTPRPAGVFVFDGGMDTPRETGALITDDDLTVAPGPAEYGIIWGGGSADGGGEGVSIIWGNGSATTNGDGR